MGVAKLPEAKESRSAFGATPAVARGFLIVVLGFAEAAEREAWLRKQCPGCPLPGLGRPLGLSVWGRAPWGRVLHNALLLALTPPSPPPSLLESSALFLSSCPEL